jgi:hypothetical protein
MIVLDFFMTDYIMFAGAKIRKKKITKATRAGKKTRPRYF